MNIITFVRVNKNTNVNELLPIIQSYDKKIKTKSIHIALYNLFKNHYQNLNTRRLYELMSWINQKFGQLPSTSNVESNLTKIRQVVKKTFGGDSVEYQKSQIHLRFDPVQKQKNISEYNKLVFQRNEQCKPIKISLINRLLSFKESHDYKKQIVYLLLNSGSRYHELFTGIWAIDHENEHNVLLSNISKTKDKGRQISKPLLDGDASSFMSILAQIRDMNEKSTHSLVNTFLKKEINQSTYFLRKAYANYAYHILNDISMAKTTYLASILGHNLHDESVARCYQGYYIEE